MVFDSVKRIADFMCERDVSRLNFVNANQEPEVLPIGETSHRINYFVGCDESKWRTGIRTSEAVLYKELYRNIDLEVYGVDPTRTITNHIHETAKTLGIEAARNLVIEEAIGVLEEQGLDVDVRHVMLVADIMPFSSHSFQKVNVFATFSYSSSYVSLFHNKNYSVKLIVNYTILCSCTGYAFKQGYIPHFSTREPYSTRHSLPPQA